MIYIHILYVYGTNQLSRGTYEIQAVYHVTGMPGNIGCVCQLRTLGG